MLEGKQGKLEEPFHLLPKDRLQDIDDILYHKFIRHKPELDKAITKVVEKVTFWNAVPEKLN